jgi:hypothetical protein
MLRLIAILQLFLCILGVLASFEVRSKRAKYVGHPEQHQSMTCYQSNLNQLFSVSKHYISTAECLQRVVAAEVAASPSAETAIPLAQEGQELLSSASNTGLDAGRYAYIIFTLSGNTGCSKFADKKHF